MAFNAGKKSYKFLLSRFFTIVVLCSICLNYLTLCKCENLEYKLTKDLFKDYDPYVRPAFNNTSTVEVSLDFTPNNILHVVIELI